MAKIETTFLDFTYLDLLAEGETAVHRLDPRAKVLATAVFIVVVVSFGRYAVAPLVPFFLFPAVVVARGNLPAGFLARKLLFVLPFVLLVGILNPLFDRETALTLGPLAISGGWVSFFSIVLRSILTVGSALVLIATTGFTGICLALERLGVPQPFVVQLLFLYRYIFVLTEEAVRTVRARELRSCGRRGKGVGAFAPLVGTLLLRTWDRAERIHLAMLCRGFRGEFHVRRAYRFGTAETLFTLGWVGVFILFRLVNVSAILGGWITEMLQ
ncbi:cobalt ECF transporter T component CbiQ [Geobacter sp.]|uniref:cobalt ECF transporter T component CbiQ n=1 Tax=Geobacter sp. TaxID=46610 RepID=UPI00262C0D0E|nr:cobalt ECF transporter T component CbiQ [Geobacter sp.]